MKLKNYSEVIELLFNTMPYVFWKDRDGKYLGVNDNQAHAFGFTSQEEFVGKTIFEILDDKESAKLIEKIDNEIMQNGNSIVLEETISTPKGIRTYLSQKQPIKTSEGEIIGLLGFSMDITEMKQQEQIVKQEKEKLERENEIRKKLIEQQTKFKQIADQMAHDLGSPLMALSVLENSCSELPEVKRNMLRESISRIRDIAGSLLSQYKPVEEDNLNSKNTQELLVYAILEQTIMDKQCEYQNLAIKFECEYTENSIFSFIEAGPISFKRMISNLINNSVEAIENKSGKIILKLDSDSKEVSVSVIDTGKGIPDFVINKILNNIPITSGKVNGHGIGFSQIHETLAKSDGKLLIDSKPNCGTTITLTFPIVNAPEWVAEEIVILANDKVLILDDDNSIHSAWDIRFSEIMKANTSIQVKHFSLANDVIYYLKHLKNEEKDNIFLLTDYELLKQDLTGLDVIENTQIKRSILVTSHYNDLKVRQMAFKINTKILPKILASKIPIKVNY